MSGVPVALVATVLRGHEADVENALKNVPGEAFAALGFGTFAAFVNADEVFIVWESTRADVADRVADAPEAEPLREALTKHTNFDANAPGRYLLVDAHHVLEAPLGLMQGPWEGDM